MARRPNYGAEKRQKEIQRQQKRDEKAEKKRLRKEAETGAEGGEVGEADATVESDVHGRDVGAAS